MTARQVAAVRKHGKSVAEQLDSALSHSFAGRTYRVNLQFRFISGAASFPTCSKRRPCASCHRKGER